MKKPILALLTLAACVATASAQGQSVTPGGGRSDEILKKIARLDSLIQIVPLALTKDQIPPILSVIEKVHQKEKELRADEDKYLASIDAKVTKVVDEGVNKDVYPPRPTQLEVASLMRAMGLRRTVFVNEMVDLVYDECKKTLNEGQLKTMEKSLKPELLGSTVKGDDMTADARIKFYIRKIILDPIAYDLLVEMNKRKAKEG